MNCKFHFKNIKFEIGSQIKKLNKYQIFTNFTDVANSKETKEEIIGIPFGKQLSLNKELIYSNIKNNNFVKRNYNSNNCEYNKTLINKKTSDDIKKKVQEFNKEII